MEHTFWHRQGDKPLFEELEWNKPERKDQAGRLLIVGGNVHALAAPAQSYILAQNLGIGTTKVALPSKTKKLLGDIPFDALFLPSTPSGEFAKDGATELIEYALWADTVLLPGDVGRNSQTTLLLEELIISYSDQIVLTRDAVDTLSSDAVLLLERPKTTLILSIAQLQTLIRNSDIPTPISFTMDLVKLVDLLHEITTKYSCSIVTLHQSQFIVASGGKVSTTKTQVSDDEPAHWRNPFATHAACFLTWYPSQPFEALTHCAHLMRSS
ncbi:hypothetical protein KBD20_01575 [Candidatus Saccharibacteria bacterium]|nr:hypothetical protein [Candidatus Saccharibacteria bacterium]